MFVRFPFDDECARMLGDIVVVLFNIRVLRGRKRNPRRGRVRVPPARVRSHHVLHYCVYVSSFAGKLRVQVMENVLNSSPGGVLLLTFRDFSSRNLGGKIFGRIKRRVFVCCISLSCAKAALSIKNTQEHARVNFCLSLSFSLSLSLSLFLSHSLILVVK